MSGRASFKYRKSITEPLVLLFGLIETNNWTALEKTFLVEPNRRKHFKYLAGLVAESSRFNNMTILHAVCRFRPPASLVRSIVELCPDAPSSKDSMHRTPLHVAAGTGSTPSVVEVLVDAFPMACIMPDQDGRLPLHMACDSSCRLFEEDGSEEQQINTPSYGVISVLLSASASSALLKDTDGLCPVEYAFLSNSDVETLRLIQCAAQRVWRRNARIDRDRRKEASIASTANTSTDVFAPRPLLGAPSA